MDRPIVVLGAGLAGLSAGHHARKAGRDVLVFEREARPGGLVRSERVAGFTFDYTGHLLHLRQERTRRLVLDELGLRRALAPVQRDAWVYLRGRYTRAPFQSHLFGQEPALVRDCLEGALRAHGALPPAPGRAPRRPDPSFPDFETFNLHAFGAGIYRHFMEPYNAKLWGVHPSRMGTDFMGRFVPRPSLHEIFAGALFDDPTPQGYNAHFLYPRRGGIETLVRALAARVAVRTGCEAVAVDPARREVRFADGSTVAYGLLVSSLPLPALVARCQGAPAAVRAAARRLKATSVLNVNFGIRGRDVSSRQWVYVPEPHLPFYRVGFYHNFSPALVPRGGSSVYAEMSYSAERPVDKAGAPAAVRRGLEEMGILRPDDRIAATWVADIPGAYVVYDRHRAEAVATILRYLEGRGIRSVGRWGRWEYAAMEDAIWQGAEAVAA